MYGTDVGPVSAVIMGALSRTITVVVVQPLTLIKTRYEVTCYRLKNLIITTIYMSNFNFPANFMLCIGSDLKIINNQQELRTLFFICQHSLDFPSSTAYL